MQSNWLTSSNLSSSKATNVCQQLSQEQNEGEISSQSGIYKSPIKIAVKPKGKWRKKKQQTYKINQYILMVKELRANNIKCLFWRIKPQKLNQTHCIYQMKKHILLSNE